MRRLLRDVADDRPLGDVTTLLDPTVVNAIKDHMSGRGGREGIACAAVVTLDHLILTVNDREASVRFYTEVMGFGHEGEDGPFSVIRVSPDTTLQLAPWGTEGGDHLAFALSPEEFDAAFARVRAAKVPFGDSFHDVGNMQGPGEEAGARGLAPTLYLFDPNGHLVELRHY